MFAFKIPIDFVSIPCDSKFLQFTSTEVPSLFLNASLHFCNGGNVPFKASRNQSFHICHESQRAAAPE